LENWEGAPPGFVYQWSRFPKVLREVCYKTVQQDEVDACPHPADHVVADLGIIDTMEGRRCKACGGYQSKQKGEPWPDKWEAHGSQEVMAGESSWPTDLVLAMVRPNAHEMAMAIRHAGCPPRLLGMNDAILMAATSCERCLNALLWRYGVAEEYAPYSKHWDEAGTECAICKTPGVWDWLLCKSNENLFGNKLGRTRQDLRSGEHYTELCRKCGTVMSQCRCLGTNKVTVYGLCDACSGKLTPGPGDVFRITTQQDLEAADAEADAAMLAEVHERSRKWSEGIMRSIQDRVASRYKAAKVEVGYGPAALDMTWQAKWKPTTECCRCGKEARLAMVVQESGPGGAVELHHNDPKGEGFWLHDVGAFATYLCRDIKCAAATTLWNQA
jgi:hypothetical protein